MLAKKAETVLRDHGLLQGLADDDHTQYIRVDGTRDFTGDQSMGANALTGLNYFEFDLNVAEPAWGEGRTYWEDGILQVDTNIEHLHLNPGYNNVQLVVNKTGVQIGKGKVVYINGSQGGISTIALADNSAEATSSAIAGVTQVAIDDNEQSYIITFGLLKKQDTSGFAAGDSLFLGTSGALVNSEPVSPAHSVFIGKVGKSNASTGEIFIHIDGGLEVNELHDVLISNITDDDVLQYDSATSLWKNRDPVTAFTDYYALLDGTNQPFTGNLQIKKSTPQHSLFDTTTNSIVSRWLHTESGGITQLAALVNKPGALGNALNFDNSPEFASLADGNVDPSNATEWSIMGVANADTADLNNGIAGWWDGGVNKGIFIQTLTSGGIGGEGLLVTAGGAFGEVNVEITDDWFHFALVYNGALSGNANRLKLYYNGVLQTLTFVGTVPATIPSLTDSEFRIGDIGDGSLNRHFNGQVDELGTWSRALTANDISDAYNSGNPLYLDINNTFPTDGTSIGLNIQLLYHLDEPSGTNVSDSSGNSFDATTNNMEDADWVPGKVTIPGLDVEISVIESKDGTGALEAGINTYGDVLARHIVEGKTIRFNINGTEVWQIDENGTLIGDNKEATAQQLILRAASSASENIQEWQDSLSNILALIDKDGGLIVNEQGNDANSRIEGVSDANLTNWDAGNDTVGFGVAPDNVAKVQIENNAAAVQLRLKNNSTTDGRAAMLLESTRSPAQAWTVGINPGGGSDGSYGFRDNTAGGFIRRLTLFIDGTVQWGEDTEVGVDIVQNFMGDTNSGSYSWINASDYFQFDDDILLPDNEKLKLGTGVDAEIYYDATNLIIDPKKVGTGIAQVLGAIGIEELSSDPTDPTEGKAVFWMGDGAGSGADGDLLYMEQSGAVVETGCLKWTDFVPSSITINASDGTTGSVSDVQTMFDGNVYQIEELAATPGYDVEFIFSNVDKYPTMAVTRWLYSGSATHDVTWDIWNYNTTAWDTLRAFQDSRNYEASMTMYIPQANKSDYVSGGAAKVRVYHRSAGNASHNIQIDYVGLTHGLQGVI
jgi:hypothetical protein